ncbi:hypothetical protein CRX72_18455 [Pantoea sp. BRM17]|nr:hypothetical protein CRX72_18455 [Pantoea sp. BRM17]
MRNGKGEDFIVIIGPDPDHHTIPFIETRIPPKKVVDDAYAQCKPELNEWMKLQEPLPDEMKQHMRKELYDFYIRMIDIRRKYDAKAH